MIPICCRVELLDPSIRLHHVDTTTFFLLRVLIRSETFALPECLRHRTNLLQVGFRMT